MPGDAHLDLAALGRKEMRQGDAQAGVVGKRPGLLPRFAGQNLDRFQRIAVA